MTQPRANSWDWEWKGMRNPETGDRTQITLTAECLDAHVFPKHLKSGEQPWSTILGIELAEALRRHYAHRPTGSLRLHAMLEDASTHLESQVRSGLEHPMVVVYRAGATESDAIHDAHTTWCVLTPSGAKAYVTARWVCTVYFCIGVCRWARGWTPETQARIAAMSLRVTAQGQCLPSGVVDTGVVGSRHRYRADLRLESERNWREMRMPRLQSQDRISSEDQR